MIPPANLTPTQNQILKKYPTYASFYTDYNPAQLLVNYDEINTIEESISRRRMRICDIEILYPDEKRNAAVEYIVRWLDFLNKFSNINKQLTELNSVAYMIFKDYKELYLSDLKIIFEKIMRAEYGPFYGSVDAQRILYGFMQYNIERMSLVQKQRIKFENELETLKDRILKDVDNEVREILRSPELKDLVGVEYYTKKNDLTRERFPKAFAEAREKFLSDYEKKITTTNGNNTTTKN